ncbi:MAG: DoxX family protein [bacterium]|nr:DoxX family protein [bacterium]
MLNLFPELLAWGLLAPLLLRIVVGLIFVSYGWNILRRDRETASAFCESLGCKPGTTYVWVWGLLQIAGGLLLIIGLYTQGAALGLMALTGILASLKRKHPERIPFERRFLDLLLVVLVSLLFSGAGLFAFDIPL